MFMYECMYLIITIYTMYLITTIQQYIQYYNNWVDSKYFTHNPCRARTFM